MAEGRNVANGVALTGRERFSIAGLADSATVPRELTVRADDKEFGVTARVDTPMEADYFRHGGILQYVLRQLLEVPSPASRRG